MNNKLGLPRPAPRAWAFSRPFQLNHRALRLCATSESEQSFVTPSRKRGPGRCNRSPAAPKRLPWRTAGMFRQRRQSSSPGGRDPASSPPMMTSGAPATTDSMLTEGAGIVGPAKMFSPPEIVMASVMRCRRRSYRAARSTLRRTLVRAGHPGTFRIAPPCARA